MQRNMIKIFGSRWSKDSGGGSRGKAGIKAAATASSSQIPPDARHLLEHSCPATVLFYQRSWSMRYPKNSENILGKFGEYIVTPLFDESISMNGTL